MSNPPISRVRVLSEPPAEPQATPLEPDARLEQPPRAAEPAQAPPSKPRDDRPRRTRDQDDERADRRPEDVDADLDRALEAQFKQSKPGDESLNFKRQKDEEVEAELAAMLADFDPATLTASKAGPRTRSRDREGLAKSDVGQEEREGIQRAKVVGIKGDTVFLDLGAKSEGIVPLEQFEDEPPRVGEIVEVVFDRYDREEGLLIMSRRGAAVHATWQNLKKGLTVEARVTKAIKGGLEVEVNGIRGFLPISQIELGRVEDVAFYLNQRLKCMVSDANSRERNLVVSRRDLLEKERAEHREKTWASLEEGQTRTGTIRGIKPFGAFVDLGGVDGLILMQNLAWGRVKDASEVVSLGQQVDVKVLHIDRESQKVSLGLKQLKSSPWDTVDDRYDIGQHVKGKVTKLMEFGAFVELEPGLEGLIHISELGPKKVWRVKDAVNEGDEVEVRILKIEPDERRISLSLKPLPGPAKVEEDEEEEAVEDAPPQKSKPSIPLRGGLGDRDPNPFTKLPM